MRRLLALGVLASLVLFGVILAAGLVASGLDGDAGPANATVTEFEPRVAVNEGDWANETDGEGVQKCTSVGPSPGNYGVTGSLVVQRSIESDGPEKATFETVVTLADGTTVEQHNVTLRPGDDVRIRLFDVGRNDGTLTAGTSTTLTAKVHHGETTVANATRTVAVKESGELNCDDETS